MKRKIFWKLSILTCFLLGLSAQESFAQSNPDEDKYDKFRISVGWFNPRADTSIRLDATESDLGTTINFEDDVGLSNGKGLIRVDGFFRFKKRHQIDFGYYNFDRNGTQTLNATIEFGDEIFLINTQVNSFFNVEIIKLSYTYLFIAKPNTTLGASIGFNISDVKTGLSNEDLALSETAGSSVPLPVFGINGAQKLGSKFWLEGHAQFLYIKVGSLDGTLFDARVAVTYRIMKNFGIGIGYNFFNIKVNKQAPDFTGRFKLNFDGVQVFASLYF